MRMSVKPKGKIGIIFLIIAILVGVIVSYSMGFAHSRSAVRIGYIGNNGWDNWSGRYERLDGKMRRTLHFDSNEEIRIETTTASGILSVELQDTSGNVIFSKSNMGTASHNVTVSGKTVVTIIADDHSGSFDIE